MAIEARLTLNPDDYNGVFIWGYPACITFSWSDGAENVKIEDYH